MALGYALLHPNRLELSIRADGHNRLLDELSDVVFGTMGVGHDLGPGFEQFMQGRLRAVESSVEGVRSWLAPSGPLGWLGALLEGNGSIPDLAAMLDRLVQSLSSVPALKETLRSTFYAFIDGLPEATSARFSLFLREQFNALTEILELPLRSGRSDRAASQGFRSAVVLRQVLGPFFEQAISGAIEFDLRALLKRFVDDLLARFNAPDIDRVLVAFASFRAQVGGLLTAFTNLNASVSVSLSVSGGPQGMAEEPSLTADEREALAATHPFPHALWWMDFVTGLSCSFCSIWEMVRSNNFKDREADGALNVISCIWQFVQMVMRAFLRDTINRPLPDADDGRRFLNWLFTDQGNLAINLLFRFLGSIHDMLRGAPNWSLGLTPSLLKYYSNVVNTRAPYLAARSYWYFHTRKAEGATTPASLNRILWAIWGPWWFFSSIFGLMPAWEDFTLEDGLDEARTIVTLILGIVIGPIAGYIALWKVSGKNPFTEILMAPDWPTFILVAALWVLGLIVGIIMLADLESSSIGGAIAGFVVLAVLVVVPMVAMPFLFAGRNEGAANSVFLHWLIIGAGLFMGGVLPYFLWWFYIDDGRDKLGYFNNKDPDTSPYKLPYRAGENWLCGQGVHGLFSHYLVTLDGTRNDNHYSYDFDEAEDKPSLASRDGVIVSVTSGNANGTKDSNNAEIQHLSWVPGHDPGTDLERVLTTGEYVHFSQNRVWAAVGQRVPQGYYLADIDNTGRSALNHLHFNAAEYQRIVTYTDDSGSLQTEANDVTYPVIFTDHTLRRDRHFPVITSWISGGGHFDGKPISMAFYESENDEAQPFINPVRIQTAPAGTPPHSHVLEIDRRALGTGAIPASVTLRTRDDAPTPGIPAHSHTITISQANLLEILGMKPVSAFATDETHGHTHGFGSYLAIGRAPQPTFSIVNPPAGQLLATLPGPYRLIGDQLILRVNERATEYFLFGAHRPAIVGDLALDRGVPPALDIRVAGSVFQIAAGATDATARGTARLLNAQIRAGLGASGPPIVVRSMPSIVIETRRRGRSARLAVTFRTPTARVASGTGAFDDISQIPPADLAAHIDTIVKNGWPAAPAGLAASASNGQVSLAIGGAAADVSASSSRIAEVFTALYDPAARLTRGRGPMPLSTGRIILGGAPPYQVPVLASHAQVRIDPGDPAFNTANLTTSPLVLTVLGLAHNVSLQPVDSGPAELARRINLSVEGVRAFVDGTAVIVQTVSGGSSATIAASKAPTGALGSPLPGATAATADPPADSCAISAETFVALIDDAQARATLPYDPAAAAPQARIDAGRLAVEVGAGHSVAVSAAFTGPPPFTFSPAGATRQQTDPLAAPVALAGPGWIDVAVDSQPPVRIPLDGECARIDLPLLDRLPASGEALTLSVNGGAAQPVTFTGAEASIADVAAAIANASGDITVRLAYVLSIENALYHNPAHTLQVVDNVFSQSPGLPTAGFLRNRNAIRSLAVGFGADQIAVPADLGASAGIAPSRRDNGSPVRAFTVAEAPAGADMVWQLQAGSGLQIRATHRQVADPAVPDPLGFPTAFAATISTAVIPPALDMQSQCREYAFEVQNSGSVVIAQATMQLSGEPAMIRTVNPPELGAGLPAAILNVTVIDPSATERTFTADLTGLATLDDIAQRLNEITPAIRAWVARPPSVNADRLHIETAGAGTGWRLRLDNGPLLLVLGFGQDDVDAGANRLEARGRGTVADSRTVTHAEIRAALDRAVACTTGNLSLALTVFADGGNIVLRSLTGPVTIETEPASLRALLNVTEAADRTTLAPGPSLATDSGEIIAKVGGRTAAVAPIWGDHATVRADRDLASIPAADAAVMLGLLTARSIRIRVDGALRTVPPVPASAATLDDAVEWIAGQTPEAWAGIAAGRLTFESRGAGASHTIEVDFSAFTTGGVFPAIGILGFEAAQLTAAFTIFATGRGSVASLNNIPAIGPGNSLETLLRNRAAEGASPQAIYDAEVDTSASPARIRLRTHVLEWTLRQATPLPAVGPGSLPFNPPGGAGAGPVLESPYPAPQPLEPGVFELQAAVDPALGGTRRVTVLVAGQAARLPALGMPTSVAVLNGRGFDITVGATVRPVRFAASASTTPGQIAAQIERQCAWTVRAAVNPSEVVIETVETGAAKSITLAAPPAATPNAITNDPATGFTLSRALPVQTLGAGAVPAMDAVSAADLQSVLARANLDDGGTDASVRGQRTLDWRPYDALGPPPAYTTITSRRDGCISAIEPVVDLAPPLRLARSLARGPAVRGSVALPAFVGTRNLSGTLSIQLNDNPGVTDIAAPVVVSVTFPAGSYSAREVARRIHEELWARGIGQAGAYPDGTVVIESRVNGLAGTVRIPAPGTGSSGADETLLRELIGTAPHLFGRGYPGAGFLGPLGNLRNGGRSRPGNASAAATWVFQAGAVATAPINITAGQPLSDIQRAVDSALAAAPGGRIGICVIGPDDTLHIEQTGPVDLVLIVDGAPPPMVQPQNPGETAERREDPAVGLRFTRNPRTVRYSRDRFGNAVEAEFDDCGWVRIPIHTQTGATGPSLFFPGGLYWTAIRNDGAKTREYHPSGDMIISGGVDPADASLAFVHQARYWMGMDVGQTLRIVRNSSGEFLVEVLW